LEIRAAADAALRRPVPRRRSPHRRGRPRPSRSGHARGLRRRDGTPLAHDPPRPRGEALRR
jgi:hypothetical protein